MMEQVLLQAAERIRQAKYLTAFSGAGISVESGIPPFRGPGGIWNKYDPAILDLDVFIRQPERAWPAIKEMFLGFLSTEGEGGVQPNVAHNVLAKWEAAGRLKAVITQNIDGLHVAAGSRDVVEYHGHCRSLVCLDCGARLPLNEETTQAPVQRCSCGGLLKPDFVFFGEGIPPEAMAAALPMLAKQNGATIIEVNPGRSDYTASIVDIFIPLKAGEAFERLEQLVG